MSLHQCRRFQHLHIFHPLWILFNWTFISQQTPHKASFIPFADVMWHSLLPRLLVVQCMSNHSEVREWICWHLLIYTFNGPTGPFRQPHTNPTINLYAFFVRRYLLTACSFSLDFSNVFDPIFTKIFICPQVYNFLCDISPVPFFHSSLLISWLGLTASAFPCPLSS